ncbi:MAG: hypothetical protein H6523_13105 [Mycolicibacterium sp.]|nr:hypothetical protein [Mycolicibacterium sp.]
MRDRDDAYYEGLSCAVEAGDYVVSGPIQFGPTCQPAPRIGGVGEHREDSNMNAIDNITIFLPQPSGTKLGQAIAAITGVPEPDWENAVVSDGPGYRAVVHVGPSRLELVQGACPAAAPEQLALAVNDADAALARLSAAGFEVEEVPGDPRVAGHLSVAGVRLLLVTPQ